MEHLPETSSLSFVGFQLIPQAAGAMRSSGMCVWRFKHHLIYPSTCTFSHSYVFHKSIIYISIIKWQINFFATKPTFLWTNSMPFSTCSFPPSRNISFAPRESVVLPHQSVIPLKRRRSQGKTMGMVREMVLFLSFQISEVPWVVKIHDIRIILVNVPWKQMDSCVSVGILRHMLQNNGIEYCPPYVCVLQLVHQAKLLFN